MLSMQKKKKIIIMQNDLKDILNTQRTLCHIFPFEIFLFLKYFQQFIQLSLPFDSYYFVAQNYFLVQGIFAWKFQKNEEKSINNNRQVQMT